MTRTDRSTQKLEAAAELVLQRLPLTLAALLLLAAIAINFTNVLARYLFLASIYWADEAMVFLVIWSIFLAAIAVTYDGSHLTMDLFSARLPPRWQRTLDTAIAAVCLATFAFMAWQAVTVVRTLPIVASRTSSGSPSRTRLCWWALQRWRWCVRYA